MKKSTIIKAVAIAVDVGFPLCATLSQFPVWIDRSAAATVSGLAVVFACLSVIPFLRQIKEFFKSPSAWVMWGILFLIFFALRSIIDEMVLICFFGFIGNVIGEFIYKYGEKIKNK